MSPDLGGAHRPVANRMSWRIEGTYFESCNCEPICPCRRVDGVPGGRSTWGECLGVLSWVIERGRADEVRLDGLKVALAMRYLDDEPGSPWSFVLYLDARAAPRAAEALEAIFTGRLEGDALRHFPWAWKDASCLAVRLAAIEVCTSRGGSGCGSATTSPSELARLARPRDRQLRCSRPRAAR